MKIFLQLKNFRILFKGLLSSIRMALCGTIKYFLSVHLPSVAALNVQKLQNASWPVVEYISPVLHLFSRARFHRNGNNIAWPLF